MPLESQLEIIRRGTVGIIREAELIEKLGRRRPLRVKLGVDPTSPHLHLGHTVVLRKLRQFQALGHQAVLIIGDFTALIGDPSGRSHTRPPVEPEQIRANAKTYLEQVGRVLDVGKLEIVWNGQWLGQLKFADIIKLASKMTVARLLERDDFSQRYKSGNPISLHELLYPLMQGYDSVMVRADVELGGNDQTYNLLVGRDLQEDAGQERQVCITMPILVGLDGTLKMSKSYGNQIALEDSPKDMFGKTMSIPDGLMRNYFELLTEVPLGEVDSLIASDPRGAKERLAKEIVKSYHGEAAAEAAAAEFRRVFSQKELPADIPEVEVGAGPISLSALLVRTGLARSNREARRLLQQGGVALDGTRVEDPATQIEPASGMLLRVGKLKFVRLKVLP